MLRHCYTISVDPGRVSGLGALGKVTGAMTYQCRANTPSCVFNQGACTSPFRDNFLFSILALSCTTSKHYSSNIKNQLRQGSEGLEAVRWLRCMTPMPLRVDNVDPGTYDSSLPVSSTSFDEMSLEVLPSGAKMKQYRTISTKHGVLG